MSKIWIVGATSKIAIEMARLYAKDNKELVLVARNKKELEILAKDLKIRGAKGVECRGISPPSTKLHKEDIELLIIAIGSMSNQTHWQNDKRYRSQEWEVNTLLVFDWLEWATKSMEHNLKGSIAVMSSVASDRAKKSNYGYACSKAAIDFYLEGLKHRVAKTAIKIINLKPAPTQSPMTVNVRNRKLYEPSKVAKIFVEEISKNKETIYGPKHWKWVMLIIKTIPKRIWNKLNL